MDNTTPAPELRTPSCQQTLTKSSKKRSKSQSTTSRPEPNIWTKEILSQLSEIERLNPDMLRYISMYLGGMISGLSLEKNHKGAK